MTRHRHLVDLVAALVGRDVKLRYRRSVLGLAWSQAGPLMSLAVLSFVFTRVVPLGIDDYPAFVLIGLLAWNWFSSSIAAAAQSISSSGDLVRRPRFPVPLLPVVVIGSQLTHFLLALPVMLVAAVLATGRIPVTAVALPAVVAVQGLLLVGPAWIVAALNVPYRDVGHLVGVVLVPLFYATPVFYDASSVPEGARTLYRLNPLVHLVEGYRDALLFGRWPRPGPLLLVVVVGAALAAGGLRLFGALEPTFADET